MFSFSCSRSSSLSFSICLVTMSIKMFEGEFSNVSSDSCARPMRSFALPLAFPFARPFARPFALPLASPFALPFALPFAFSLPGFDGPCSFSFSVTLSPSFLFRATVFWPDDRLPAALDPS